MKSTKTSRFSKPSHILVGSIAACAVLGLASSASAAYYNWRNTENPPVTTGNLWSTAANWTGAVPAANDTFRIEQYTADAAGTGTIIMNVNYSAGPNGPLAEAAFFGTETVSIEQYFKTTNANGVGMTNGGAGAGSTVIVKSAANALLTGIAGTIDGNITFASSVTRSAPTVEFAGGSWATTSGSLRFANTEQNGVFKVTSASGTIRPTSVLVLAAPGSVGNANRFARIEFKLAATGVAPIELQAGSNPLNFQSDATGTNPFKLNVDASLYAGVGVDIPLITHAIDTDRMFSAGNISITAVPVGKGAFVTQTDLGTTLTLADAGEWTGTTPTSWATTTNWSGGTAPGSAIPIAQLPAGVANVIADLNGATPTLAVLNINSGAGVASAYSITGAGGGNINLGATPTGSLIAAAQINVLKGTSTISAPVTLNMNAQVNTATTATTLTMSGAISGSGFSLTKGGDGTLVLSGGANSYSGATAIEGGVLSVSSLANAGANSDLGAYPTTGAAGIVLNGGTLRYTSSGASVDRGFTAVGIASTIDLPTAAATLTLGASSIGVGIVNVTGGAGSRLTLGAVTLASPTGAVLLNPTSANLTVASFTGTQNLTLGGTATDNSVTGVIGIGTGTVNKTGNGTWTLSGNNTYSGSTNVGRGTLQVSNSGNLGLSTAVNALTIDLAAVNLLNDSGTNFAKNLQVARGVTIHVDRAAGGSGSNNTHTLGTLYSSWTNGQMLTITGGNGYGLTFGAYTADGTQTITNNAPGLLTLASVAGRNAAAHTMTIRGTGNTTIPGAVVQTDIGALALTKNDAGTLTLQSVNTYTGNTTVSGGRVVMGNALALQYSAYVTTGSTGAIGLDVTGFATPILGGLSGGVDLATAITGYGSVTGLTLQPQSGTVTYTGIIANGAATTSLTKAGAGTQVLSGANSYTGGTNVNAGTLRLDGAFNMPATGTLQVNGGGNFSLADGTRRATSIAALSLASGANLTFDWVATDVDTLTSTAAATTVAGPVGISINPLSSPSGGPLTLIDSPSGGLNTATYYLANNTNFTATLSQSATAVTIGSYATVSAPTLLFWQGNKVAAANTALVDNALALSSGTASNWSTTQGSYTATGVVPGSTADVIFSTTATPAEQSTVMGANMTVKSVTFHDANAAVTIGGNNTLTLSSTATGAGSGTGAGGSAITVTSAANATNTISANILLGANQTWNVATGKTLAVSGAVSGTFNLTKASPGALVLSGGNSYTGTTTVSAGTLVADHATALGTTGANTSVSNNATLDVRANIGTEAISIAGAGVGSAGALITADTFTGTVGGTVTITGGSTRIGGAGTLAINGVVTGGQPITKVGAGVTTFAGANTYTGVTTVSGGVLRLNSPTALPGGIDATVGASESGLTINGGGIVGLGNGDFTRALGTGNGQVQFTSTGGGGFAAYTADRSVNFGGAGAEVTWGSGSFVPTGQPLILGAAGADMTLTMVNPIALGATTRTVQVNNGSAGTDAVLSGNITGTATTGGLNKTGTGALNLNGTTQGYDILNVNDGTANVNGTLGTAPGLAVVTVTDAGNGTKLRFGTVSQTLSSLTIGAGATVIFTSGLASGSLTGDDGGGKAAGFGSPASSFGGGATVPEPGTLGLLLVGALGMLNRRRRA